MCVNSTLDATDKMDGQHRISLPLVKFNRRKESTTLKGPLRVFRLCLLSILLPGILIAGPLYLRYHVFSEQVYPLGMSDMRLVDNKISTTWCQKQLVKSNATFSAYLLPEEPRTKPNPVHVSMVKYLNLEDDMKEYWGFYLLKGSSVTVSTCCRWPGASLIVIKGHRHLRECAYIGDDSSEELEEVEEFNRQRAENGRKESPKAKTSDVWPLKKARPSIEFHSSSEGTQFLSDDISLSTGEEVSGITRKTQGTSRALTPNSSINKSETENIVKANSNFSRPQTEILKSKEKTDSEEIYADVVRQIAALDNRNSTFLDRLKKIFQDDFKGNNDSISSKGTTENTTHPQGNKHRKREITLWTLQQELNKEDPNSDAAEEEGLGSQEEIRGTINGTTANDMSNSEFWSSFSSSEERLLSCAGLILNLPLTPSKSCHPSKSENTQAKASLTNKLTYKVPSNGYYFFVFSSENEIQPNYIRIHFHLEKILYNVSNPVAACTNTTDSCSLPLNFFSSEKVVLEMPINENETLWNQEYVVVSVCEPRTMVYAACVIAVPVLILLFAF